MAPLMRTPSAGRSGAALRSRGVRRLKLPGPNSVTGLQMSFKHRNSGNEQSKDAQQTGRWQFRYRYYHPQNLPATRHRAGDDDRPENTSSSNMLPFPSWDGDGEHEVVPQATGAIHLMSRR